MTNNGVAESGYGKTAREQGERVLRLNIIQTIP
jgi:hypothetical protein